jgi:hypothetical protein
VQHISGWAKHPVTQPTLAAELEKLDMRDYIGKT